LSSSERAAITVAPNQIRWQEAGAEAFEALNEDLTEIGLDPWTQTPRNNVFAEGGIVIDQLVDVSFFLWDQIPLEIVGAIVSLAVERLYGKVRPRREQPEVHRPIGTIYGADSEVLRRFYLDTGDPVEAQSRGLVNWFWARFTGHSRLNP
jgi:hypothetical protein